MFTVHIEGLEFYGYHGVSDSERSVGHRYLIDLSLEVEGEADKTDSVSDTVDYGLAAELTGHVFHEAACSTVERLAAKIAERLLESFPLAVVASVTVSKPLPPMPFVAAAAGATVTRAR